MSLDKFNPDGEITRAEFAALLVRSLGLNEETDALSFTDVGPDEWYTGVIGAAVSSGLINGYKDGTFRPDALISREQMVTMIRSVVTHDKASTCWTLSMERQTISQRELTVSATLYQASFLKENLNGY